MTPNAFASVPWITVGRCITPCTSAMPQTGQVPGSERTISGCIGQVYSTRVAGAVGISGSRAMPHLGHGPGSLARTSGSMGQTYAADWEVVLLECVGSWAVTCAIGFCTECGAAPAEAAL